MVMGSIAGAGLQGPPGPAGPPGPPGSGIDSTLTFARYLMTAPPPWEVDEWSTLDFNILDGTTDPTLVQTGPDWRFTVPSETFVHLLCSMQIHRVPGDPLWQLRVIRNGSIEETLVDVRGYTAQIGWIGRLGELGSLHVEIQPLSGPHVMPSGDSPRSSIALYGLRLP